MRNYSLLLGVCLTLLLAGCATKLSEENCASMNWYQKGYDLGVQGRNYSNLKQEREQCARYEISVDDDRYQAGWRAGTRVYCTPQQGYQLGANGQGMPNVCPEDLRTRFENAWHEGIRHYCVPENAYALGVEGKANPHFCPPDLGATFDSAYKRGHRIYTLVSQMEGELRDLQSEISRTKSKMNKHKHTLKNYQNEYTAIQARSTNSAYTPPQKAQDLQEKQRAIQSLRDHMHSENRKLDRLRTEQQRLQRQITEVKMQRDTHSGI